MHRQSKATTGIAPIFFFGHRFPVKFQEIGI
jgi:hypothetical protein